MRLYAHFDPKVSYCQGMNYVMGFLYCQFRDEDLAFNFFVAIINKYMKQLFENDLISLKTAFYQLDRLIGIFLPDLAKVFKVTFFLSLFSGKLKKNREKELIQVSLVHHGLSRFSQMSSSTLIPLIL